MLPQTSPSSLAPSPLCFVLLGSAPHLLVSSSTCDVVAGSAAAVAVVVVVVIAHDWHFLNLFWLFFQLLLSAPRSNAHQFVYLLYCLLWLLHFASTTQGITATTATAETAETHKQLQSSMANENWFLLFVHFRFAVTVTPLVFACKPRAVEVASQVEVTVENVTHHCHWNSDRDGVGVGDGVGAGDRALHKRNNAEHAKMPTVSNNWQRQQTQQRQTKWLANQPTNVAKKRCARISLSITHTHWHTLSTLAQTIHFLPISSTQLTPFWDCLLVCLLPKLYCSCCCCSCYAVPVFTGCDSKWTIQLNTFN